MKFPVYMDYHATTPVDPRVMEAMIPFFTEHFGNAASLQHRYGWIAKEAVEGARKKIAQSINAQPQEIIFTSGATESNNLAIKGVAESLRHKGRHIITTAIEHACVVNSCNYLERNGFSVTYLPVNRFGEIEIEELQKAITSQTILVSVMSANNEIGTIQPIDAIGKICAERGIVFHSDATQAIGKIAMDVQEMNIHLLSFSSHKIYGPKGVGALYVRSKNPKIKISALIHGGGHEHNLRSGTLNVSGIVGFGKAVSIAAENFIDENLRVGKLRDKLWNKLQKIDGINLNGHPTKRISNNLSITIENVYADMLMTEMSDVAISAGSACTNEDRDSTYSHVLRAIGKNEQEAKSTVRLSLGRFTTEEEVDFVAEKIHNAVIKLRMLSKTGVV